MDEQTSTPRSPQSVVRRSVFLGLCGLLAVLVIAVLLRVRSDLSQAPLCDPGARPPAGQALLGQVTGQRLLGTVWIHFTGSDLIPGSFSYTSDGASRPGPVLKSALAALQNDSLPMQPLAYASLGLFTTRPGADCVEPDPALRGYVVAEVWERQVSLGYGGAGLSLRPQAAQVVAREIDRLR